MTPVEAAATPLGKALVKAYDDGMRDGVESSCDVLEAWAKRALAGAAADHGVKIHGESIAMTLRMIAVSLRANLAAIKGN
jgi:hypothetical protein